MCACVCVYVVCQHCNTTHHKVLPHKTIIVACSNLTLLAGNGLINSGMLCMTLMWSATVAYNSKAKRSTYTVK